jgi:hypothetical protein
MRKVEGERAGDVEWVGHRLKFFLSPTDQKSGNELNNSEECRRYRLGNTNHISTFQSNRNSCSLNRRGPSKSLSVQSLQDGIVEAVFLPLWD